MPAGTLTWSCSLASTRRAPAHAGHGVEELASRQRAQRTRRVISSGSLPPSAAVMKSMKSSALRSAPCRPVLLKNSPKSSWNWPKMSSGLKSGPPGPPLVLTGAWSGSAAPSATGGGDVMRAPPAGLEIRGQFAAWFAAPGVGVVSAKVAVPSGTAPQACPGLTVRSGYVTSSAIC